MPNMSDSARKRTLADWVVKTKKQVVKLYAVAKWSRDADTIQKCMVAHLEFLRLIPNLIMCILPEYHRVFPYAKCTV